jgi:hypothetical protein
MSRRLNAYEFAVALLTVWFTLMGIATLWPGRNLNLPGSSVQSADAAKWFVLSAIMLSSFAIFRTYNRKEIEYITGKYIGGPYGEIFMLIVTVLATAMLVGFYWPKLGTVSEISSVVSGALSVVTYIHVRASPEQLRPIIGSGTTWPALFLFAVVVLLCVSSMGIGMLL